MPGGPDPRRVVRRRGARIVVLSTPGSDVDAGGGSSVLLHCDTDPGLPGSRFWQPPGGGIDEGETDDVAAARELYEETGLEVDPASLGEVIATRTVTHGYSDRILIQDEVFYRIEVPHFTATPAALTEAEAKRRVSTQWFPLSELPADVWPVELAELAQYEGDRLELGEVEESTVPLSAP